MKIEVEWKVEPASGITNVDLEDLGCKSMKEWNKLSPIEKNDRLKKALMEYDGNSLEIIPTDF